MISLGFEMAIAWQETWQKAVSAAATGCDSVHFFWWQIESFMPHPDTRHHWKELSSIPFAPSLQVFTDFDRIHPQASSFPDWTVPALSDSPHRRGAPIPWASWLPFAGLFPVCPRTLTIISRNSKPWLKGIWRGERGEELVCHDLRTWTKKNSTLLSEWQCPSTDLKMNATLNMAWYWMWNEEHIVESQNHRTDVSN